MTKPEKEALSRAVVCPLCHHVETEKVKFCSVCGVKLDSVDDSSTLDLPVDFTELITAGLKTPTEDHPSKAPMSLVLRESGEVIPLLEKRGVYDRPEE